MSKTGVFKINEETMEQFFQITNDLDKLLTERISDLYEVKGGMQSRHAYMYYRDKLHEATNLIQENSSVEYTIDETE